MTDCDNLYDVIHITVFLIVITFVCSLELNCTWHRYAISCPAINGFVSLLSGISIEECCVYAYVLGFKNIAFFLLTYVTMKAYF